MKTYNLNIEDALMKRIKYYCLENEKSIKQCLVESVEKTLKEDRLKEKNF